MDLHRMITEAEWLFGAEGGGRPARWQRRANIITDSGLAEIAARNVGASDSTNTHCAVGTGGASEAMSDATLETERARKAVGRRAAAAGSERYSTVFQAHELGGLPATIREAGLLTAAAGGVLVHRVTCEPIEIIAGRSLTVIAVVTHKNGSLL